ncbi:MAG: ATP synthase F1 subunit gamma [Candidatus Omnitrophica bacterium]|nr:ATP synthase F1 subunit gamma [Candidatus Omnitrophota bacterium]
MPQPIKQIKNRIRSVENTRKVTAAMQLVSVAKLNRSENALFALRPYALRFENLMHNLAVLSQGSLLRYFNQSSLEGDIVLCVITSDSGLCGAYNQNIFRVVEEFLSKHGLDKVKLILLGQKGLSYFRNKPVKIINSYLGQNAKFAQSTSDKIATEFIQLFLSGKANSIYLAYTYFENSIVQKATIERLLAIEAKEKKPIEYISEPDLESLLEDLVPQYLLVKMRLVFLEAFTSEHAARTISMKTATDNALELLEGLLLLRNKVRQAGITQDILEISSSVEALKG